jgi:hypothetical protein
MRMGLLAVAPLLLCCGTAMAADPAIVFQMHPFGQALDEVRSAMNVMAGEQGVKALNKSIKTALGEKGFEGLDIGRPIFGYVLLAPKPEDITAVVAFPITGEKEFLDLCERANHQKPKLVAKEKDLYELPPLDPRYKAVMRFWNQYAYISYGAKPVPALDPKSLVPLEKVYVPTERGIIAGRIYFDRIPLAVKLALPVLMNEVKKTLLDGFRLGQGDDPIFKAIMPEIEKLVTRYAKLAEGADEMAARIVIDAQTGNLVAEATLNGKPGSPLSKIIADRKATGNKFGGLISTPDTVAGIKVRLPLFEDEIRAAAIAGIDAGTKESLKMAPMGTKPLLEELVKGISRTIKTGEFDLVMGVRGPDKNGLYSLVGAVAFEDTSNLETTFKKSIENDPMGKDYKWDVAKAGKIGIHTWKPELFLFQDLLKHFGGDDSLLAFAFAPQGVFIVFGPDPVNTMKGALAVKPAESPVFEMVLNPAQVKKLANKLYDDRMNATMEALLGSEDKLKSAMSMTVEGGKELKATFKIDLRLIPRSIFWDDIQRATREP